MTENKGILNFTKDSRHFTSLINGAYGGVVGDGTGDLIEIHLFCETNPEIDRIEVDLASGREVARLPNEVYKERKVLFTALVTVRAAKSIAQWLLKNVEEARKVQAQASPPDQVH